MYTSECAKMGDELRHVFAERSSLRLDARDVRNGLEEKLVDERRLTSEPFLYIDEQWNGRQQ